MNGVDETLTLQQQIAIAQGIFETYVKGQESLRHMIITVTHEIQGIRDEIDQHSDRITVLSAELRTKQRDHAQLQHQFRTHETNFQAHRRTLRNLRKAYDDMVAVTNTITTPPFPSRIGENQFSRNI